MKIRLTSRGWALTIAGICLIALGALAQLPDVIGLGAGALATVTYGVISGWRTYRQPTKRRFVVERTVTPPILTRGDLGTVLLTLRTSGGKATAGVLRSLSIAEQAAPELAGPTGLKARTTHTNNSIQVHYQAVAARRGRFELGPVLATRVDLFGTTSTTSAVGGVSKVAVWPRVTELDISAFGLSEHDPAGSGSRLTAPDDNALREYVPGDDPRRVHWPTSARRGELVVRAAESAGKRAVTILFDVGLLARAGRRASLTEQDGEWALEYAASLGCALLKAGHSVRFTAGVGSTRHFTGALDGRAELLDSLVDLSGTPTVDAADAALIAAIRQVRLARATDEMVLAVIRPPRLETLDALRALGMEAAHAAAFVVTGSPGDVDVEAMRVTGWRVSATVAGGSHARAWSEAAVLAPC